MFRTRVVPLIACFTFLAVACDSGSEADVAAKVEEAAKVAEQKSAEAEAKAADAGRSRR